MFRRVAALVLTSLVFSVLLWGASIASAHALQSTATPVPATPVPATPAADVVVELRQPPQPPQNFWERYGLTAKLIILIVGGVLSLFLNKFIGPTVQDWGEQLREHAKGEGGRFLGRYVPALAEDHRYLKLVGIYGKEWVTRPPLEEVYVSLHMGDVRTDDVEAIGASLSIVQAMQGHEKLVILGEPGAGKSTLMDWLTLVFCGEIEQAELRAIGDLLPIYLPLRACAIDARPLHELMADPKLLPFSVAAPANFFETQLNKGGCLVLLDGLDEVVDSAARDTVAEKINHLVRAFPKNRYVVTCRTAGWKEGLFTFDFARLLIRDFSDLDAQRFVSGWYRAVRTQEVHGRVGLSDEGRKRALEKARRRASTEAQALIDALAANLSLSELARNPLILSLIALVHYRRRDLPQGRGKLYQECLEILLDVWDREDKEIDARDLSLNAKETVLRHIAYDFHTEGLTEADAPTLEAIIEPLLPDLDCNLDAEAVLKQIEERSGILVARTLESYVFAHRTLQEYLTAKVLAASPQRFGVLLSHLHEEPWREVTLLYAGMVDDATAIVRAILVEADQERTDGDRGMLVLAGQCLVEDVTIDKAVRADVLARLEAAFEGAEQALAFEQPGRTLAAIGGQDVVSVFGRMLVGGATAQQAGAARALGRLGAHQKNADAIAALLIARLDEGAAPVRRAAALGLADLGVDDEGVIGALEEARTDGEEQVRAAAFWALLELGEAERYGMVPVPAGEFEMGSDEDDPDAQDREKPKHRLYLDDYYIARHPVTNAEFARFVEATGYQAEYDWKQFAGPGREQHPVVFVSWRDAMAYATWMGAHLPSEAQWEKAAGWDEKAGLARRWPWGDTFDNGRCNYAARQRTPRGVARWLRRIRPKDDDMPPTTPVGQYSPDGDSSYGCTDMAGNVWEWCSTIYRDYPYQADDGREQLDSSDWRVLRGGSWLEDDPGSVCCAYRDRGYFGNGVVNDGFRVARGSLNAP